MKRLAVLLAVVALSGGLAGCAHRSGSFAASNAFAPYGGLPGCAGYFYSYDPYNPSIIYPDDYGFSGPCTYPTRYYTYPYTYTSAPSIEERQQVIALHRSGSPRVVGPRGDVSAPSPSSYSSGPTTSVDPGVARSPVTTSTSTGSHPAPQPVSPR